MLRKLYVFIFIATIYVLQAEANLLEIIRLQNQLKRSYIDIELLEATYKNKIKEAIQREKENTNKIEKSPSEDELSKCKEQNSAFEVLNKIYAEQIQSLQSKVALIESRLTQKDDQMEEGLKTVADYAALINDQAERIRILTEDVQVKSQIIFNMEQKSKNLIDQFKNLEDFGTEIEANSCLPFGNSTNIHLVKVDEGDVIPVSCESRLSGPGWTVIQRRFDGSVPFYRNWLEYKEGFGNLSGEFFIGLEKLHRITKSQPHELYIHLTSFGNETSYAHYDNIVVGGELEDYALSELGVYSGTAGDSLRDNEHLRFSTFDRDNDLSEFNCAENCLGGWWYSKCGLSNLNGQYSRRDDYYDNSDYGIYWDEWLGPGYTMQSVQMMIRPKN